MVSAALRVVSAASTASAALLAALVPASGPDPKRVWYLAFVAAFAALGLAGHALADTVTRPALGRVSPTLIRGIASGLSLATGLLVLLASGPLTANRSAILALLAAAGVHAFGCLASNDSVVNGLIGAGAVGISILSGNPGLWAIPAGLLWGASFAGQLTLAHRHELATKISHPPEMGVGSKSPDSDQPWLRTITAALVALLVLGMLALLVPPIETAFSALGRGRGTGEGESPSREPGGGGGGTTPQQPGSGRSSGNRPPQTPGATGSPGDQQRKPSGGAPGAGRGSAPGGEPGFGLDLNRIQEPGDPNIFAVVNAPEPRLMRTYVFTIYTGEMFLSPEDKGVRLDPCPCFLPTLRDPSVPFTEFTQVVEFVADYEGPLPAAFEARQIRFRVAPDTTIALAEGGVLLPGGVVRSGTAYSVTSQLPRQNPQRLASLDLPVPAEIAAENTQLPYGYSRRVANLARDITAGSRTPYEKANAITDFIVEKHRLIAGEAGGDRRKDAVERYLFDHEMKGIGDDAVVASVVLMRAAGIPARVGFGYRPRPLEQEPGATPAPTAVGGGSIYLLDKSRGTTWVEFYVSGFGWVTADIQPLLQSESSTKTDWGRLASIAVLAVVVIAVFVIAALVWRRVRRKRRAASESEARSLMRMLEQAVGIERLPTQTPAEYGAVLWSRLPNADREHAMLVLRAIVQLSYTRDPLTDARRSRVYQALAELRSSRKEREQRARHARPRRKTGT